MATFSLDETLQNIYLNGNTLLCYTRVATMGPMGVLAF